MASSSSGTMVSRLRQRLGLWRRWRRDMGSLRAARRGLPGPRTPPQGATRLVVVPSDPWTLVGARGDEAMICAAADHFREQHGQVEVMVLTATPAASAAARQRGWQALETWTGRFDFGAVARSIRAAEPTAVVLLGADVMDGYYSPTVALRLLGVADLCARQGIPTALLGFSFNRSPYQGLAAVYDSASDQLLLNVRDEVSLQRLQAFTHHGARLVADSAFRLRPEESERVQALAPWLAARRQAGQVVLGFNAHPMLVAQATPETVAELTQSCVAGLRSVLADPAVAVMLVPHDFRGDAGDLVCLRPIHAALQPEFGDRVLLIEEDMTAPELKAVASRLDALITGRMHLAIAALGMGVPVGALTYQDKFQGLFRHFGLPESLLLAPEQLQQPDRLSQLMQDFLAQQPALKARVGAALPQVKALSAHNFEGLG